MKFFTLRVLLSLSTISLAQPPGAGNTIDFTGTTGEYIDLNTPLAPITYPFTISLWYKPNNSNTTRFFISHDQTGAYRGIFFHYNTGGIVMQLGNGTSRSPTGRWGERAQYTWNLGEWHHITAVQYSASQCDIYVNGNLIPSAPGNGTGTQTMATNNTTARLGSNYAGNNITYMDGQMDNFCYWDKALTANEVRDLMCTKLQGNEPDLRIYLDFDGTTGTTIDNKVAGGPDGTLVGNPARVASSAPIGDRSVHNGHTAGNFASGVTGDNDTVQVTPGSAGDPGTHIYFIDQLPTSTTGINLPNTVNSYWGVFNSEWTQSYTVDVGGYGGGTGGAGQGSMQLAERDDNTVSSWNGLNDRNIPNYNSTGHSSWKQMVIALSNCPPLDPLPDSVLACAPTELAVPQGYTGYNWSTGATSNVSGTISSSMSVWVEFTDPSTGCMYSDTTFLQITTSPDLVNDEYSFCQGDSVLVSLGSTNYTSIAWSNGSTAAFTYFSTAGMKWVEVTTASGCTFRDDFIVSEGSGTGLSNSIGDTVKCLGENLVLTTPPGATITWPNGSSDQNFTITGPGSYTITIDDGCTVSTVTFEVSEEFCGCNLFFPTAFSPNGDGINDTYGPGYSCNLDSYRMEVYSREGALVFSTNDADERWDGSYKGRKLPEGTYVFRVVYQFDGRVDTRSGYFSILP